MYSFDPGILPSKKDVYIVGGSVRDLLLGIPPADYDLMVMGTDARIFAEQMAQKASGRYVCLGKKDLQVHRIVTKDFVFDISQAKGDTLEADLYDRDFTINAMAFSIETKKLVDITGGTKDLAHQTVRMVSDTAFLSDPLRMLRAFRVSGDLGFGIEPRTLNFIRKNAHRITDSAPERIHEEWFKLLSGDKSYTYLTEMAASGLLFAVFPELEPLEACGQNSHHAYNVFEHTLVAYENLEEIMNHPESQINGDLVSEINKWDKRQKALLKHTLLFHDIGKPASRSVHADGNVHFYKHASIGVDKIKEINARIKFSNFEDQYTCTLIKHHIRPLNLFILSNKNELQPHHVTRFFIQANPWALDILLHSIADHRGKGPQRSGKFTDFVLSLADDYIQNFKPRASAQRLLTGNDLKKHFHISPSPLYKKILDAVEEQRLSGQVQNREQALALAEKLLADIQSDSNS